PPVPPSLPTRRSSDLCLVAPTTPGFDRRLVLRAPMQAPHEGDQPQQREGNGRECPGTHPALDARHPHPPVFAHGGRLPRRRGGGDRKSTRLNSSHVKI